MVLSPATQGQLSILAPGLPYSFLADGTLAFTTTNAASYDIRISPADGYVWADQSKTTLTFKFTIRTVKLGAPRLNEPTAVNGRKTVVYKPSGDYSTLTIENVRRDEVKFTSAMTELSWVDSTLVLCATNARDYYVSFEPASANYEWAPGATISTFVLVIEKYTLATP